MPRHENIKIGDFILIPSRGVLTGAEGEVALEPKVVDVLLVLGARPGVVVSRDELVEAVWKMEFGANERVTRAISLLRKAFGDERGASRYIETVPKRGYRLVAAVGPAPEDAVAASAGIAELPPEALPPPVPPQKAPQPWTQWRLVAVFVGVAATLGLLTIAGFRPTGGEDGAPALAQDVVELEPLRFIGGTPENAVDVERFHASLKQVLASNQVLLLDRSTAKSATDQAPARSEFALSGSLEQSGSTLAVTVYFDNRGDGQTLWSKRFSRPASQVENLREEVAVNTANVIGCALNDRRAARAASIEAMKLYLLICEPYEISPQSNKLALARRLTKTAPDVAFGHGLRALIAAAELTDSYEIPKAEVAALVAEVRSASARALELDPTNALAQIALSISPNQATTWLRQGIFVRAGIDHYEARQIYFKILRETGRLSDALRVIRRSVAETALCASPRLYTAIVHMQMGEPEEAERLFQATLRITPDSEGAQEFRFYNAAFYGKLSKAPQLPSSMRNAEACFRKFAEARARGGRPGDRSVLSKVCKPDDAPSAQYLARMVAALGDVDGAYEIVKDKPLDWTGSTTFLFYPEMAAFRKNARFMPFIASSGLLEAWIATDRWPDFCRDPTLPYNCKAAAKQALAAKRAAPHRQSGIGH